MGKTHYAHVDRANESDNTEYWSSTACGLEYTESLLTDKPKEVTCKNCLRAMARHKIDESVLLISGVVKSEASVYDTNFKCSGCGAPTILGYCTNECDD